MPYESLEALPESVKNVLPEHAREIYHAAYNSAWESYEDPEDREGSDSRETVAHKVAWSAVKQKYKKDTGSDNDKWVKK